ncbi:MAG: hypothetical protein Q9175_007837 [Cornicularia normoerica]
MSKDAIDKWLDALRFDIYRLGVKPDQLHADTLAVEIDRLERLPVTAMGNDLHARLDDLESAKQDLASIQHLIGLTIHLRNLRDQMRENGFLKYSIADADQVLDGLHAWLEKTKREQRERQWRNLTFFRRFWPEADGSTRRQMETFRVGAYESSDRYCGEDRQVGE